MAAAVVTSRLRVRSQQDGTDDNEATATPPVPLPPLLVTLLAGNPVTGAAVLTCLDTVTACTLRRLHPAVAGAVADVPWDDMDMDMARVKDVVRWREALPGAVGAWVARLPVPAALAAPALANITRLNLRGCKGVTDAALLHLPPSLRELNVSKCGDLTHRASFTHLTALESFDCTWTGVVGDGVMGIPAYCHPRLTSAT